MSQIKLLYRNILESSTVAVTSENTSFPKYRLYDRDIGLLFKGNSTPSFFIIYVDQPDSPQYEINHLIIPAGHNLSGLVLYLKSSPNNIDWTEELNWTQSGSGLISKSFTAVTRKYWQFVISSPSSAPELAELFLGKDYIFTANPVIGAKEGRLRNLRRVETSAGLITAVKKGELRRIRNYQLVDLLAAQKTEFQNWESHCEGIKGIWIEDHLGELIFMEKLNDEGFDYDNEDETGAYYNCQLELRELLARIN